MNKSNINLLQKLKQAIIKQKSNHLEAVEDQSPLQNLYQILYQYDEHVSKLVFRAFQGSGNFTPFVLIDTLEKEIQNFSSTSDPEIQRLLNHYRLYKQRLDEIYNLLLEILTSTPNGEKSNDG